MTTLPAIAAVTVLPAAVAPLAVAVAALSTAATVLPAVVALPTAATTLSAAVFFMVVALNMYSPFPLRYIPRKHAATNSTVNPCILQPESPIAMTCP